MSTRYLTLTIWGTFVLWSHVAFAQTRTTTSGSSSSSGATQVQAAQPQNFSSNAGNSTSASSGSTTQTGGTTSRTNTGTQNRMNSANQPQFNAGDGSVGARVGQNSFVGQGENAFIGARDANQMTNSNMTPQFNQVNDPSTSQRRANSGSTNVKRARPQQRISFIYPKANLVRTQGEISQRFKRLKTVSGADTTISDEGVATLIGTVTDEDARKLAEALARLEPGVRSVENRLQVGSPAP